MTDMPEFLSSGEKARLFPVLADTSKEGRTLSIFMACLEHVPEFGRTLLASLGQRLGTRADLAAFTEVTFKKSEGGGNSRPDGLIVVSTGSKTWSALVEAKVGRNEIEKEQLERYLQLAKEHKIDAVITLSNQLATLPTHHPVSVSKSLTRKVELYHWSWMYVLTEALLLSDKSEFEQRSHGSVISELIRFFSHESAGLKSFDQMPADWSDTVADVRAGATLRKTSPAVQSIVGSWHQEIRDLALILTRLVSAPVQTKLSRAYSSDPTLRLKADTDLLVEKKQLIAVFIVPNSAAPIELSADLQSRCLNVSMTVRAPEDRKSLGARLTWLTRQIAKSNPEGIFLRAHWPRRRTHTQLSLKDAMEDGSQLALEDRKAVPHSFEVVLVREIGARFSGRRPFIQELERAVPDFYQEVGQHLKAWSPAAPKVQADRSEASSVDSRSVSEQFEQKAIEGD